MAFLPFDEHGNALLSSARPAVTSLPATPVLAAPAVTAQTGLLSALEWAVVRLARGDRLGSLDVPGRFGRWLRSAMRLPNPRLADDRLEALRRLAVLTWHYGLTVPGREVSRFLGAGFSADQYEAVVAAVGRAQLGRR